MAPPGTKVAAAYKGMSMDNITVLVLALSSSSFIGASFIRQEEGVEEGWGFWSLGRLNTTFWLQALNTFNTALVSPIYYVMFTSLTILASVIMFKDWDRQNPTQIVTELCGFATILSGTFLLHKTKDMAVIGDDDGLSSKGILLSVKSQRVHDV